MSKQPNKSKPVQRTNKTATNPDALQRLKVSLGMIIAVFAFLLYAQSIGYSYTLDDNAAIKNNTVTRQGIAGIPAIVSHNYWYGINDLKGTEYRPLSMVLFAIEWQLFPENPHVNRFINVLLYALSCWFLFQLLCRLFPNQNLVIPFVCSLLYVSHPIHSEVVDSIKSRDDILCFLFLIIATLYVIKAIETNSLIKSIVVGMFYLLALLSKETAISFLLIIPMLMYVFTKATLKNIASVFIILILFTGVYFIFRTLALESITHAPDSSPYNNSLFAAKDFISREATAFYILLRYLFLMILPHPLTHDYSFNQIPLQTLKDPMAILGIVVYIAIGAYAIITIKNKNILAFAILFFLISLAPVANVFRLIGSTMAERFLYIPSLGYCLIVAILLAKYTKTEVIKSRFNTVPQFITMNSMLFAIVFAIVGLYSIKTFARSQDWKNNSELYSADAAISTFSSRAHVHNAVTIYEDQYPLEKNEAAKQILLDKAISEFKKALEIFPEYHLTYQGLGQVYIEKGDYKNAIFYLQKMVAKFTDGRLSAYLLLNTCYEKTHQLDLQIASDDSVISYQPTNTFAHINKGTALGQQGKYLEAVTEFETALTINPNEISAYKDLGVAYGFLKQYPKAIANLNKAATMDPNDPQVPNFMGITYNYMGDTIHAKECFDKANKMTASTKK